jgi:hypothetical protein
MTQPSIEIAPRFCGPPTSGNGGYVAGLLAGYVDAPAVGVRLHIPPPLGKPLVVEVTDEGAALFDGESKVAETRAVEFDLDLPTRAPGFEEATEAVLGFRGFDDHIFPGCFVCGTERAEGDGLRIFPGPSGPSGLFAAPWIPDASLAADGGPLPKEFVWAALDCPGAFSFPQPEGRIVLLGEMQMQAFGSVSVGERCVLASWEIEAQGRKHFTGSALYGESGECRGAALGVWFEVDASAAPGG